MNRKRISMTSILVVALIGTVLAIVICSGALFLQTHQRSLIHSTQTAGRQTVSQVSNIVHNYLEDIRDLMDLLGGELSNPEQDRDKLFETLMRIRPDIVAVTTYSQNGDLMGCWALDRQIKENLYQNLSFSIDEATSKGSYISTPHVVSFFDGYYPWVVSVVTPMDTEQGEAWVCMDIRFSSIASYINDVGIGQHGYCFLIDTDGNIIYHPQQQLLYAKLKKENTKQISDLSDGSHVEKNVIYSIQTISEGRWRIVGVSFVDEMIAAGMKDVSEVLTLSAIAILIMSVMLSIILSQLLSRPIHNLTTAMGEFEQDANSFSYTPVSGIKEVALLSESFSHMVRKIQELMATVREEEINLRKTELRALQAQINPHFLYNTLDSISWMCEQGRNSEAVQMVNALARLFRISISRGNELISISSELQHAESYLQIQAHRYRNQFEYKFCVDEECLGYLCNKITLQPIIENAIYHGINGLVDEGVITISVSSEEDDILFVVEDNGNGMEPEQVEAILRKERSDHAGIGIKNVNDRLKIYFGSKYGITIHSVPDEGTRVEIRMPKVKKEGEYEKR